MFSLRFDKKKSVEKQFYLKANFEIIKKIADGEKK